MEFVVGERDVYRRREVERGVGCSVEEAVVSQPDRRALSVARQTRSSAVRTILVRAIVQAVQIAVCRPYPDRKPVTHLDGPS